MNQISRTICAVLICSIMVSAIPEQVQAHTTQVAFEAKQASSCYWGNGSGRKTFTPFRSSSNRLTYTQIKDTTSSSCRDINFHIEVQYPRARGCSVDAFITIHGREHHFNVSPNRWYAPIKRYQGRWSAAMGATPPCGKTTVYWAS